MPYGAMMVLPGGAEWLCLLVGLAVIIGFVLLVVYLATRRKPAPPPYVPRICGSCGRGNVADARFCSYCGQAIP